MQWIFLPCDGPAWSNVCMSSFPRSPGTSERTSGEVWVESSGLALALHLASSAAFRLAMHRLPWPSHVFVLRPFRSVYTFLQYFLHVFPCPAQTLSTNEPSQAKPSFAAATRSPSLLKVLLVRTPSHFRLSMDHHHPKARNSLKRMVLCYHTSLLHTHALVCTQLTTPFVRLEHPRA